MGQVFLFVVSWLYCRLRDVPKSEWKDLFLAYDNMCNLNRLLAARQPLPLPEPYSSMWQDISKIIDDLHISNHKNPECRRLYGPQLFDERFGTRFKKNTMAAEQTFSWLVRFKKQANSMPKERQIFFIHRLITLRNRYVEHCIATGRKVVGPGKRTFDDRAS